MKTAPVVRPGILVGLAVAAALGGLVSARSIRAQTDRESSRWEKAIRQFEEQDARNPPPKHAVLFIGSSSIVRWNLKKSFPNLDAINRGFGGSQIIDAVNFAPRIIFKYEPRTLVFFGGDNDLNAGKPPEQVVADFAMLAGMVHEKLPKTKVVCIGIKPSPSRWKLSDKQKEANALIKAECDKRGVVFVDVYPRMLDAEGKPRPELFVKDMLHMNDRGYAIWTELVGPLLK